MDSLVRWAMKLWHKCFKQLEYTRPISFKIFSVLFCAIKGGQLWCPAWSSWQVIRTDRVFSVVMFFCYGGLIFSLFFAMNWLVLVASKPVHDYITKKNQNRWPVNMGCWFNVKHYFLCKKTGYGLRCQELCSDPHCLTAPSQPWASHFNFFLWELWMTIDTSVSHRVLENKNSAG